jgi:hypothetical protein
LREQTRIASFEEILEVGLSAIRASLDAVHGDVADGDPRDGKRASLYRHEGVRCVAQWLNLMAVSFWSDFIHYAYVQTTDPQRARRLDRPFAEVFWEKWVNVNRLYRFRKLLEDNVRDFILPALPLDTTCFQATCRLFPLRLSGDDSTTILRNSKQNPDVWISIRHHAIDSMSKLVGSGQQADNTRTPLRLTWEYINRDEGRSQSI